MSGAELDDALDGTLGGPPLRHGPIVRMWAVVRQKRPRLMVAVPHGRRFSCGPRCVSASRLQYPVSDLSASYVSYLIH